jgi:hypothetical protein
MVLSAIILPGCGMAPHDGVQRLGVNVNNAVLDSRRDELRDRLAIVPAGTRLSAEAELRDVKKPPSR